MRVLTFGLIAGAGIALGSVATQAQPAYTTRVETRPAYGAIVTIEKGVRVFRPLPPHDRIIMVPRGAGPIVVDVSSGARTILDGTRR